MFNFNNSNSIERCFCDDDDITLSTESLCDSVKSETILTISQTDDKGDDVCNHESKSLLIKLISSDELDQCPKDVVSKYGLMCYSMTTKTSESISDTENHSDDFNESSFFWCQSTPNLCAHRVLHHANLVSGVSFCDLKELQQDSLPNSVTVHKTAGRPQFYRQSHVEPFEIETVLQSQTVLALHYVAGVLPLESCHQTESMLTLLILTSIKISQQDLTKVFTASQVCSTSLSTTDGFLLYFYIKLYTDKLSYAPHKTFQRYYANVYNFKQHLRKLIKASKCPHNKYNFTYRQRFIYRSDVNIISSEQKIQNMYLSLHEKALNKRLNTTSKNMSNSTQKIDKSHTESGDSTLHIGQNSHKYCNLLSKLLLCPKTKGSTKYASETSFFNPQQLIDLMNFDKKLSFQCHFKSKLGKGNFFDRNNNRFFLEQIVLELQPLVYEVIDCIIFWFLRNTFQLRYGSRTRMSRYSDDDDDDDCASSNTRISRPRQKTLTTSLPSCSKFQPNIMTRVKSRPSIFDLLNRQTMFGEPPKSCIRSHSSERKRQLLDKKKTQRSLTWNLHCVGDDEMNTKSTQSHRKRPSIGPSIFEYARRRLTQRSVNYVPQNITSTNYSQRLNTTLLNATHPSGGLNNKMSVHSRSKERDLESYKSMFSTNDFNPGCRKMNIHTDCLRNRLRQSMTSRRNRNSSIYAAKRRSLADNIVTLNQQAFCK